MALNSAHLRVERYGKNSREEVPGIGGHKELG